MALLSEYLPVLLFGLIGGVAADRFDRRRMVVDRQPGPDVVLAALVVTIATGVASIGLVLVALFILGTAETFADSATSTLLPGLVAREDLGIGNARIQGALAADQPAARAAGRGVPVRGRAGDPVRDERDRLRARRGADLASRHRRPAGAAEPNGRAKRDARRAALARGPPADADPGPDDLHLQHHVRRGVVGARPVRQPAAGHGRGRLRPADDGRGRRRCDRDGIYGRLERRFKLADIMRVGLLIETCTHLVLALTTSAVVALGMLVVFGAHAFVWGTTSTVVRQRAVPDALLGRVSGVYRVAIVGGLVIGTPIGGLLATRVRDHRAVLVRVRRLGAPGRRPVAPVREHRPLERGLIRGVVGSNPDPKTWAPRVFGDSEAIWFNEGGQPFGALGRESYRFIPESIVGYDITLRPLPAQGLDPDLMGPLRQAVQMQPEVRSAYAWHIAAPLNGAIETGELDCLGLTLDFGRRRGGLRPGARGNPRSGDHPRPGGQLHLRRRRGCAWIAPCHGRGRRRPAQRLLRGVHGRGLDQGLISLHLATTSTARP